MSLNRPNSLGEVVTYTTTYELKTSCAFWPSFLGITSRVSVEKVANIQMKIRLSTQTFALVLTFIEST